MSVYPSIGETGIIQEVHREFVRTLQAPRAGFALFAGKETRVAHWGIETVKWREAGGLANAVVSMDIPPVSADSGTITARTTEIPIFTKDVHFSGRKWRQLQESGLDPIIVQEAGKAMAEEINKVLLLGTGTGMPGPDTGLLNASGINTVTGGNWATATTGPDIVNQDLAKGMMELRKDKHYGPYTIVMNPADSYLLDQFIANSGGVRIGGRLPSQINRVLYDDNVGALDAYIIDDTVGNFDVVVPRNEAGLSFGLGTASADFVNQPPITAGGSRLEKDDPFMMERTIRWMNILAPRVFRAGDAVARVDFTIT